MTFRHWSMILLLSLAALLSRTTTNAQDKIRMGLSSVSALHTATWVAQERGFFRKYNLDAEVIITGQGGTAGIAALLANDIQMVSSAAAKRSPAELTI